MDYRSCLRERNYVHQKKTVEVLGACNQDAPTGTSPVGEVFLAMSYWEEVSAGLWNTVSSRMSWKGWLGWRKSVKLTSRVSGAAPGSVCRSSDVGAANQMKAGVNRGGVGVGAPRDYSMQNHYFVQFLLSTDKIILTCDLVSCWYLSCFMPLNKPGGYLVLLLASVLSYTNPAAGCNLLLTGLVHLSSSSMHLKNS